MAATQGHTQSLHTNALDEALALPTDFSARIARNTQLLLQQESGTTKVIDPWGGSHYVERLTYDLARRAWAHITEVEKAGGHGRRRSTPASRSCGSRKPPRAPRRGSTPGASRSSGSTSSSPASDEEIDVLRVDNAGVRAQQLDKLRRLREERDQRAVDAALTRADERRGGDRRGRAPRRTTRTCWPCRSPRPARRPRWGRSPTRWRRCSGATPGGSASSPVCTRRRRGPAPRSTRAREAVAEFAAEEGRQPRILVAKMGQDGHDRGQKVIATAFADLGFDVDVGPLFSTPAEVARQAVEADVHVVGVSSLAAGHLTLVPELRAELARLERPGHHGRRRRGDPARGRPDAARDGRGGGVRAGHRDRRGRGRPAREALGGPARS